MKPHFEGFYYKHQATGRSLALIPGRAEDGAFIQVITDTGSHNIPFSLSEYRKSDILQVGGCCFSSAGVKLNIRRPELMMTGDIRYKNLTPINGDIMGPFRFFPMECRHGIVSMRHELSGAVTLNGETLDFTGGVGYIEADSGRSFPKSYAWVQCNDFEENCSVMASVAKIPFYELRFWGCVCVVWLNGREYRLATYNGVKILRCEPGVIELRQGKYQLKITVDTREGHALSAPVSGRMNRTIRESLSCPARLKFTENGKVLLDSASSRASYEFSMDD